MEFRSIPGIKKANSPVHAKIILKDAQGNLHNISFRKALDQGLLDWQQYPVVLRESPYWLRLISASENTIAINLSIDTDPEKNNTDLRAKIISAVSMGLDSSLYFTNYGFAGEAELTHQLDQLSMQDLVRLLPIAFAALFILLLISYRKFSYVFITTSVTACTLLVALNVNQWLGYSFNVISASLPILIMIVAIADSIHILRRWQINIANKDNQTSEEFWRAFRLSWQQTWLPCLFTSVTSAVGFGIFYLSKLIPLSQFGATTFISILLAYPVIMLLTFTLIYVFQPGTHKTYNLIKDVAIYDFTAAVINRKKSIIFSFLSLLVVFSFALPLAKSETNFLDVFFHKDSKTRKSFDMVDSQLSGSGSVDIILQSQEKDFFKNIDVFNNIKEQVSNVGTIDEVRSVSSLLEPVKMVHGSLSEESHPFPSTNEGLAQELLFLEFSRNDTEEDVLSEFIDFDYKNSRIKLYTPNMKSDKVEKLHKQLSGLMEDSFLPYILTGASIYFYELSAYVVEAQFFSMSITGLFVWLIFIMKFGFRLGTVGLISSITPVFLVLYLQILFGIPFDFSTVLVASICLGLCIDDTIHYIHRFNSYHTDKSLTERLQRTSVDTWQPIFFTTVVLLAGFLVLLNSNLVVINRFSMLTSLAIILTLVASFLLLPAMLHQFSRQKPSRSP